jgi:N-acetylglutamate synthase-like GNAT family acetyltransferase
MFLIRTAKPDDNQVIRKLIQQVRINPTGIDWHRFLVATDPQGALLGCAQIKPHRDGSFELASVAVRPEFRRQGIAGALIRKLLESHAGELYLICRSALGSFYETFGFQAIGVDEMPPYFKRINHLARWVKKLEQNGEGLLVMRRYAPLEPVSGSSPILPGQ